MLTNLREGNHRLFLRSAMKRIAVVSLVTIALCASVSANECGSSCAEEGSFSTVTTKQKEAAVAEINQMTPSRELLHDRWYRRVRSRTDVFDSPGGQYVRTIEEGFNFVTALAEADGWTQINPNEWVRTEQLAEANYIVSNFTGVFLPFPMPASHTYAWVLVNLYPSPAPGADPSEQFDLIPRYTLVEITDTEIIDGDEWYQVAPERWVHQYHVARIEPLEMPPPAIETDLWIGIDLYEQVLIVYEQTQPVFATLVSTGLDRWPTYEGVFSIYFRRPREFMSWGTVGDDFYSLEEVPWTMFFDEGRALHGAYWHDGFGYRRSHGCVNMSITDAKWLYEQVADYMGSRQSADREEGPAVYVYSTGEYE